MEKIKIWAYEIVLIGKSEGSSHDADHWIHKDYFSSKQIHENNIITLETEQYGRHQEIMWDAIMTNIWSIGVHTADCLPIALLGRHYYAIIHGSWKTLHAWILQSIVKNLCRQEEDVVDIDVYIWPCIKKEVYEVGPEFHGRFPPEVLEQRSGKLYLNLVDYTSLVLQASDIQPWAITVHPDCTYQQSETWFSYRKGDKEARNFMGVKKLSSMSSDN